MKKILLFKLMIIVLFSFSQDFNINLKSGDFQLDQTFDLTDLTENNYRLMLLKEIPTDLDKKKIEKLGVNFLEYIPDNKYIVSLDYDVNKEQLLLYKIVSINRILPSYKIDRKLKNETFPEWSIKDGMLFIKIICYEDFNLEDNSHDFSRFSKLTKEINYQSNYITLSIKNC